MRNPYRNIFFTISFILAGCLVLAIVAGGSPNKKGLADVDGAVISASEVEAPLGRQLSQLNQQIYDLKQQRLKVLIDEKLLSNEAKRRGMKVPVLLDQEVRAKILPVTDDEVETLYNANRARISVELDKVRGKIREFLTNQRRDAQKNLYLKSLRANAKITTYLSPPPVFRASVSLVGEPSKGPEKAPVTIVKFEDFQCPYCKTVQPTFAGLLKRYGGKIRLVHKDLPLEEIHPLARQAAEAARCASEQGKFWSYHDKLYAGAPKLSADDLKNYAKEVGLKVAPFEQCLGSGKYKAVVQKDLSEGARLGLTGTPTFFINGRELSGAQPIEAFATIIDEELARAK